MSSDDAPELDTDDFGRALLEKDQPPSTSSAGMTVTADPPPAAMGPKYPPFRPAQYRDNPFAQGINGAADRLGRVREGTASKDNLGESMVYAFEAYSGQTTGDPPPYAHVLISAGRFTIDVVVQRREGATADDKRPTDDPHELQRMIDDAKRGVHSTAKD